ncbi:ArsR family transcriptional regulator [Methanolobus psychrophilus R15]|nr:ArsR family transcriptional regulator [Methanolobus psychrophilus R15]
MKRNENQTNLQENHYSEELAGIKADISSLSQVVARVVEQANDQQLNIMFSELKNDISKPLINYMIQDSKNALSSKMCTDCDKKEICRAAFEKLLQETALLLMDNQVGEEMIEQYEKRFEELRELATTGNCDSCTSHASEVFRKQLDLIRSLNVSGKNKSERLAPGISELPDEVVSYICEPLANKQRLLMLRALSTGSKSFSELSRVTGLRGGNLLFHLQKLTDSKIVSQRNERGDYFLTQRGYTILHGLAGLYKGLQE